MLVLARFGDGADLVELVVQQVEIGVAVAGALRPAALDIAMQRFGPGADDGIERDRDDGAGENDVLPVGRQQAERDAEAGQDEREFADLRQPARHRQAHADGIAQERDDDEGDHPLADDDQEQGGENAERLAQEDRRIEQHANGHEEQHRKRVLQRQGIGGGAVAEAGFAHDHASEEGAERERHAEDLRRAEGDAERQREHGQGEELARAGAGDADQQPRHDLGAEEDRHGGECADLQKR